MSVPYTFTAGALIVAAQVNANFSTLSDEIAITLGDRGPILIAITGQSNAVGVNNGGGNPSNPLVKTWNPLTSAWVSGGQYTAAPWTSSAPTGNSSNNNFALSAAHYIAEKTGREVYVVYDARSGQSITEWVPATQTRYAALKTKVEAAIASPALAAAGKTTIDFLIWAQGEENGAGVNFMGYATYRTNLTTLDDQFRAETWMEEFTPVFIMGMSPLHDRYAISPALQNFSNKSNGTWRYLSTRSLRTEYQKTGSGDYTHWLGPSLWEGGYNIIGPAFLNDERCSQEAPDSLFYGRGNGAATMADPTAISTFTTLVSWDSRDLTASAVTSPAATGSMMWGYQCVADGNYTFALGYENVTDNLSNYTILAGRSLTSSSSGDYAAGFGYQNALNNTYTFAAGRGHTLVDSGTAALGLFSAYTTTQADPVVLQLGAGTSTSSRRNAVAFRASGVSEHSTLTVAQLPAAGVAGRRAFVTDANATTFASIVAGGGANAVPVYDNGTNWCIG